MKTLNVTTAINCGTTKQKSIVTGKFILAVLFTLYASITMAQTFDTDVPMGWAVVPGYYQESTIGGGNGEVVTAKTYEELYDYTHRSEPLVILVEDTIIGNGKLDVSSDKTIMGVGSNATFINVEVTLNESHNIIVRNLTIKDSRDGIASKRSHHIWIDHCDVSHCEDGAIDITNQADLHTVSWTRLSDHDKTMLINGGSEHFEDEGYLNTSLHHMWWDGTVQRNPRVGFGKVHVFNSLYTASKSYGIGLHTMGYVLAENNYFDRAKNPIHQMYRMDPADIHHGFCESVNNIFDQCTGDQDDENVSFRVNDYYLYDFFVDDVADIPTIVKEDVGPDAKYGTLGLLPTPGQGAITTSTSPTLRWTKGQSGTQYKVYFGETNQPILVETTSEQTYSPGQLSEGSDYYWRVDQVIEDVVIEGKLWVFRTSGEVPGQPFTEISYPSSEVVIDTLGDITVTANALDSTGTVVSVEFFDGKTSLGIDDSSPYSALWASVKEGRHMLKAKVTDNDGNTYVSDILYTDVKYKVPGLEEGYELCSKEGEKCNVHGVVNVAYGSDGNYSYIFTIVDDIDCSAATFDNPGINGENSCYVQATPIPYAVITLPTEGREYAENSDIRFYAKTEDNEGDLDSIKFYQNNIFIKAVKIPSTSIPSFAWRNVPTGRYSLVAKVTDREGNSYTSEAVNVTVGDVTGISDQNTAEIVLYPNPVSGELHLKLMSRSSETFMTLKNSQGKLMRSELLLGNEHLIDLQDLPSGLYFITLNDGEEKVVRKIIKK